VSQVQWETHHLPPEHLDEVSVGHPFGMGLDDVITEGVVRIL
jgi:hypothetical protein